MTAKIAVLGAGQLGVALAHRSAVAGHQTKLWGRSPLVLAYPMGTFNRFSAGPTHINLQISSGDQLVSLREADLIFVTTDSGGVEDMVAQILEQNPEETPVLFVQKGLVNGMSPARYASELGLCAGSFTGAAFAKDIFVGSHAEWIVAANEGWICEVAREVCKSMELWVAVSDQPDAICAANVARTVASIEMGIVAGYRDWVCKREEAALCGNSGEFTPTEVAAATSGIQDEWISLAELIHPGFSDVIYPRGNLTPEALSQARNVRKTLRADNYLCSGLIPDPREGRAHDHDSRSGVKSAKSISRNWLFGRELGRFSDVDRARQVCSCEGVVEGDRNAQMLYERFGVACPPFLSALGRILLGQTSVQQEVAGIRNRRDGWFA